MEQFNGQYPQYPVNDILLVRDQQGEIWLIWSPALPIRVIEDWIRDLPRATVKMKHQNTKWIEGLGPGMLLTHDVRKGPGSGTVQLDPL